MKIVTKETFWEWRVDISCESSDDLFLCILNSHVPFLSASHNSITLDDIVARRG